MKNDDMIKATLAAGVFQALLQAQPKLSNATPTDLAAKVVPHVEALFAALVFPAQTPHISPLTVAANQMMPGSGTEQMRPGSDGGAPAYKDGDKIGS